MPDDPNKPPEGEAAPKYMTEEAFNKAMGGYRTRIKGDIDKALEGVVAKIAETIGSGKPAGEEETEETPAPTEPKSGKEPTGKLPSAAERRIRALEQRALKAEEAQKKAESEKAESDNRTLRDGERAALARLYKDKGVRETMIDIVVDAQMAKGNVLRDPDDPEKIVWRKSKDELVDLAEGVGEFMKSPAGKDLLPAKGTRGSGATPGSGGVGSGSPKPGDMSDADFMDAII